MTQAFEPIETEAGILSGRDAIHLDEVRIALYPHAIELKGELNSTLCSKYADRNEWIKYSLKFLGVLAFKMTELELKDYLGKSSFDYVANSDWLNELREKDRHKIKPTHKHYIVFTYDDVFDVICESFEITLLESRLKQKE
jgi:hypothetical protein